MSLRKRSAVRTMVPASTGTAAAAEPETKPKPKPRPQPGPPPKPGPPPPTKPKPEPAPEPAPEATPKASPKPTPTPTPVTKPKPTPRPKPAPKRTPRPTAKAARKSAPTSAPAPAPEPSPRADDERDDPAGDRTRDDDPRTPEAAFDQLYLRSASGLLRQVELLTGNPPFARHTVARAFDLAWQHWPEVARDPEPVGWVRAAAYQYALAPWQRWVPGHRTHPRMLTRALLDPEADGALRAALLRLPADRRQTVLLHDGLGIDLPEAAEETQASTMATAGRVTRARAALAAAVPDLDEDGGGVAVRLGALLDGADGAPPDRPEGVRGASERGVRRRTLGVYAVAGLIAAATVVTIAVSPDHSPPPARHTTTTPHASEANPASSPFTTPHASEANPPSSPFTKPDAANANPAAPPRPLLLPARPPNPARFPPWPTPR
jgi:DNA-directed RNA polymerase specialized sigma24 family protein